jgi:NAD(P)-dependent dehydrogenase (short-subunit alcohol dehydrogenase family)
MKNFENKVVVITGAGSGIGRALAIEFHNLGAKLALNDFNKKALLETAEMVGGCNAIYFQAFDVSKKDLVYQFAENVMIHYGQVDAVINNAGVAISKLSAEKTTILNYEWILGINLWGMIYGSLAFLPHLRNQKEASLVNLSSILGIHAVPFQAGYCTSKFAIRGFTESVALEELLNQTGVTVSLVHPGGTKTNIARNALYAADNSSVMEKYEKVLITSPERAAKVIIDGIRTKKNRIVIGRNAKFRFIVSRVSDRLMTWLTMRYVKRMI